MFISLSKTIGKFGGVRIGVGKRITSKNAWWMLLLVVFGYMLQLTWYMCILCFWLMYAILYGMWWCCVNLFGLVFKSAKSSKEVKVLSQNDIQSSQIAGEVKKIRYCDTCGEELIEGNSFCVRCGSKIE